MSDDYLWDKSGEPDADVARMEEALAPLKYASPSRARAEAAPPEASPAIPLARRGLTKQTRIIAVASLALAASVLLALGLTHERAPTGPSLAVTSVEGAPRIGSRALAGDGRLVLGAWLETDGRSRAAIQLADIGHVDVAPGSRVRLTATGPNEQRLELAQGRIDAKVLAPPRLFVVDTPSARATDLGCAYRLEVGPDGGSVLRVASGAVELAGAGRDAWVPAGAACETRPGKGPGCPYFTDASEALVSALRRFDFDGDEAALTTILAEARKRDTLTLWYLHRRTTGSAQLSVLGRLQGYAPWSQGAPTLNDLVTTW